jgi:hypothetical protein
MIPHKSSITSSSTRVSPTCLHQTGNDGPPEDLERIMEAYLG